LRGAYRSTLSRNCDQSQFGAGWAISALARTLYGAFADLLRNVAMTAKTVSFNDFPKGDLWIFGYGSLIWRPGFDYLEARPAKLIGEHRALCIYSFVHRGTPEKPGLVLGLDRGGACQGMAYRVAENKRDEIIAYLRAREQVTSVYREVVRSVWLDGDARERVSAIAYVADRGHEQYAGRLSLNEQLHLVRGGHGSSGANDEYVIETVTALEAMNIRDSQLHQLAAMLRGDTAPKRRRGAGQLSSS
jgi:glutathione-specific gamma-glutamylcyclotransferase